MMMRFVLIAAITAMAARAATVPPSPSAGPADVMSSVAPPDTASSASPPPVVTATDSAPTDTAAPTVDNNNNSTQVDVDVNTTVPATTTVVVPVDDCKPHIELDMVKAFTNLQDFADLSENQQIFIYEVLAAAELCRLKDFMNAETAQRFFLLAEDLPLKYVYTFVSFMARSLETEGVVVPV